MRRPSRAGLSLVLAFCAGIPVAAQNLESIGQETPFSVSGGISFNQILYSARGIALRRDPYTYIASASLNFSIYGWSVPFSFSISDKRTSFAQPFNQYSFHPTWKWITAHAGYTSMSFSPYTVNGHVFLGGAIDIAPQGKWSISALCGRFLKPVEHDSTATANKTPVWQRMGYGLKARYAAGRDFVDVILFHASDVISSIGTVPDSLSVAPEENLAVSIGGGKTIAKYLLLKAELAASAITRDKRAQMAEHRNALSKVGLFRSRLSSSYYKAFRMSLDYQKDGWVFGVAYEKVDPGYRTLGAYYFNSDLENITVNGSSALMHGKLNIAASAGLQHDNLDNSKISTMRRMVGSMNLNYAPSQKFNLSASYSSFQTHTNIRSQFETINQLTPFENLDTLNFIHLSRNAALSGAYSLAATDRLRQHINMHMTLQDAADHQGNAQQSTGTRFYNMSAGYSITLVPGNMSIALNFNATINNAQLTRLRMMGPTASVTRSFRQRKFRTTLSSAYNRTYSNGVNINTVFNNRWNVVLSLARKHNVNVSVIMVTRVTAGETAQRSFTELTGTVGYSYALGENK